MNEKEVICYSEKKIQLEKGCRHCPLLAEINDGMNISYDCIYLERKVNLDFSNDCRLDSSEKGYIDGKKFVKTSYIVD